MFKFAILGLVALSAAAMPTVDELFLQVSRGHAEAGEIDEVVTQMHTELNNQKTASLTELREYEDAKKTTVKKQEALKLKAKKDYDEFVQAKNKHVGTIDEELKLLKNLANYVAQTFRPTAADVDDETADSMKKKIAQSPTLSLEEQEEDVKAKEQARKKTAALLSVIRDRLSERDSRRRLASNADIQALLEVSQNLGKLSQGNKEDKHLLVQLEKILTKFQKKLEDEKASWEALAKAHKVDYDGRVADADSQIADAKLEFERRVSAAVSDQNDIKRQKKMLDAITEMVKKLRDHKSGLNHKTYDDSKSNLDSRKSTRATEDTKARAEIKRFGDKHRERTASHVTKMDDIFHKKL